MAAIQQQMAQQIAKMNATMARTAAAMAPARSMAPPPGRLQTARTHGGAHGGQNGQNHSQYQLVRPQLVTRMHQRVAAAPYLPYDDYDSDKILYEQDENDT
jgi:hypothetical protein